MGIIEISYFSDVLCVWAYISEVRIDAIKEKFGEAVRIEHHFCSVFGDTATKVNTMWKEKGGYAGFNAHLRQAATPGCPRMLLLRIHPTRWNQKCCRSTRFLELSSLTRINAARRRC